MDATTQHNQAATHPLAGQEMTGAQMIVQVLADEGADRDLRLQRRRDPADL